MRFSLLVSMVILCCARVLAAEATPKSAPLPETFPTIFAPPPVVPAGRPRLSLPRAISPEMSKKLSAAVERVVPSSATRSPVPSAPPADSSSDVLIMDPFVVNEDKELEIKDRQLLTPKEKLALAHRKNPGLKLGPIPLRNNLVALELLEDEFARQRRSELTDLSSVLNVAGKKASSEVQRKFDKASMRKDDWLNQRSGTPFREPR